MDETNLDEIDGVPSMSVHVTCPRCIDAGLVTESGYVPKLVFRPDQEPPFACVGVHGALDTSDLIRTALVHELPAIRSLLSSRSPGPA